MNRKTFIERAQALHTQKRELAVKYEWILSNLISDANTIFRPFHWRNYGASASDKTQDIHTVLQALRLSYIDGNDAPRGGRDGDYIVLTSNAKKALRGAVDGLFIYDRRLYCYDGELPADTPVSRDLMFDLLRYKSDVKKVMGDAKVLPFSEVKEKLNRYSLYELERTLKVREIKKTLINHEERSTRA